MKTAKVPRVPLVFTTYDIGRMTGTDPTTVHKWIDKGLLRGYRTPGGHRRVGAENLRSFLVEHRMPIPQELSGSDGLRVMIVDSEPERLRGAARGLKKLKPDWDVVSTDSGVAALLALAVNPPDVLVYDLSVPDAEGLSVFRQLRKCGDTAEVTILALAGKISGELERKATKAGANSCLRKPLDGPSLVTAIERAAGLEPETD
ncbi:MAG: response regulator [Deltaproteobacteria bacterium]|nr:response regulator [Deltaproteobacteria bacterium]